MSDSLYDVYCDNCGEEFLSVDIFHIGELPCDIVSALKGESGSLCGPCFYPIDSIYNLSNSLEKE